MYILFYCVVQAFYKFRWALLLISSDFQIFILLIGCFNCVNSETWTKADLFFILF